MTAVHQRVKGISNLVEGDFWTFGTQPWWECSNVPVFIVGTWTKTHKIWLRIDSIGRLCTRKEAVWVWSAQSALWGEKFENVTSNPHLSWFHQQKSPSRRSRPGIKHGESDPTFYLIHRNPISGLLALRWCEKVPSCASCETATKLWANSCQCSTRANVISFARSHFLFLSHFGGGQRATVASRCHDSTRLMR